VNWVRRQEDAREFPSLTEAIEWCVDQDLGEVSFVLQRGDTEVVLDPFDVDEKGKPRNQQAHTARVMLESAVSDCEVLRSLLRFEVAGASAS
jgi:hypothetical protein